MNSCKGHTGGDDDDYDDDADDDKYVLNVIPDSSNTDHKHRNRHCNHYWDFIMNYNILGKL